MIIPTLRIQTNTLGLVGAELAAFPDNYGAALQARMPELKARVLSVTAITPGPPPGPILAKMTVKQRRAFLGTNGFGRGIPTPRMQEPGGVLGGYDVTLTRTSYDGQIDLTNDYPGAVFIVGEFQQPFHADTGWIAVDDVQAVNEIAAREIADLALNDVLTGVT